MIGLRGVGSARSSLAGIDLEIASGELIALIGPSGAGKTSLLRIVAGLDFADTGTVRIAGKDVSAVPADRRRIGVVFQGSALFRHMTVAENVAFGLTTLPRALRPPPAEIARRVTDLLALVALAGFGARAPATLSGGEQQRVALARALAIEPSILLLDEPFGALDGPVRQQLRTVLRDIHDRLSLTTILVSHDREEALQLADRIVVLDRGRIAQVGTPEAMLDMPASAFVHGFVAESNRIAVTIADGAVLYDGRRLADAADRAPGPAALLFRPHDIRLIDSGGIAATVTACRRHGSGVRATARIERGETLTLDLPAPLATGAAIAVMPTRFRLFDRDAEPHPAD